MEKAMIVSRCSTSDTKQDLTRQTQELKAKYSNRFSIVKVVEYYKSGRSNDEELDGVLKYAIAHNIDHIIFTEVSRIARRVIETLVFMRTCTAKKINVVISQYDLNTLNTDKTENVMTTNMLNIASIFSNMELQTTKQRLNSGRSKYIAAGGRIGRSIGSVVPPEAVLEKHKDVVKALKKGLSIRDTMTITRKSNGTVQKVKQLLVGKE